MTTRKPTPEELTRLRAKRGKVEAAFLHYIRGETAPWSSTAVAVLVANLSEVGCTQADIDAIRRAADIIVPILERYDYDAGLV